MRRIKEDNLEKEYKEKERILHFMRELEEISKKYGITISGSGIVRILDPKDDKDLIDSISYDRGIDSGDIMLV